MYKELNAYTNMFKTKNIINEADEDLTLDELDEIDVETDKKEPAKEKTPPKVEKPETKSEGSKGESDMKFSVDLATEFSNTINEFTTVCAKIVEARMINKELSDKFFNLHAKIKNLAEAASKTS
jgi:hypothetical protein